ncbi:MAG: hypothetical protein KAJ18_11070 [Candidatus Omnitrophica bacterium]|nr:hypothetical protein [Candidatus Omnitrophota bacterium]
MFSEEFIEGLPQDSLDAQQSICKAFEDFNKSLGDDRLPQLDSYLAALAFAQVYVDVHSVGMQVPNVDHADPAIRKIVNVTNFFNKWKISVDGEIRINQQTNIFEAAKDRYASMFGKGVFYEFSDDDFKRVQALLNHLRDLLVNSKDFEAEHRGRLLKRLEALQAELHKKMSNFDKLWGFIIDSGIAFNKFWKNGKPFIDDVKEIMQIVCETQARAENVKKFFPLNLLTGKDGNCEKDEDTE